MFTAVSKEGLEVLISSLLTCIDLRDYKIRYEQCLKDNCKSDADIYKRSFKLTKDNYYIYTNGFFYYFNTNRYRTIIHNLSIESTTEGELSYIYNQIYTDIETFLSNYNFDFTLKEKLFILSKGKIHLNINEDKILLYIIIKYLLYLNHKDLETFLLFYRLLSPFNKTIFSFYRIVIVDKEGIFPYLNKLIRDNIDVNIK